MSFEVDVNGILCVTAMDLDSKRETSRRLKISGPSAADIERSQARLALSDSGKGGQRR